MNNNDKRVIRTEALLREALAELLLEKNIEKITISELTNKVGISRGAFYAHYNDIYSLYNDMEKRFFDAFNKVLSEAPPDDYKKTLRMILDFIQDNAIIVRCFSSSNNNLELRHKLTAFLEKQTSDITLYDMHATNLTEDWKYMIHYHISGIVSLFTMWIESNFSYPKEKLLQLIFEIDLRCDSMY